MNIYILISGRERERRIVENTKIVMKRRKKGQEDEKSGNR